MKKVNVWVALGLMVATTALFSLSAAAAACLDVRDYGYHRYMERRYPPYVSSYEFIGFAASGNGIGIFVETVKQRQQCICGAERVDTYTGNTVYKKIL